MTIFFDIHIQINAETLITSVFQGKLGKFVTLIQSILEKWKRVSI